MRKNSRAKISLYKTSREWIIPPPPSHEYYLAHSLHQFYPTKLNISSIVSFRPPRHLFLHFFFFWHLFVIIVMEWQINKIPKVYSNKHLDALKINPTLLLSGNKKYLFLMR